MIMEESEEVSEAIIEDRTWKRCLDRIVQNIVLVSGLAGFAIGMIITTYVPLSEQDKFYIGFPGEILIRMFQMVSIPLIVTAVVSCVSETVDIPTKMARNVAVYFVLTTLVSVAIGLILVVMVKPGVVSVTEDEKKSSIVYVLLDVASNMVPHNLVQACFQQYQTDRLEMEIHTAEPNSSVETLHTEVRMVGNYVEGANILGLTVCSFTFGIVLKGMGERGRIILNVLSIINQTTKYVVNWILCYLPVGLLFLITRYVVEVLDLDRLYALGNFLAVVFLGLIIHAAIVLPIVYLLSVRRNPWVVFRGVYPALWTALLTSSSSATLLQTFHCCEQRISINRRITCLMLPIATNVSMNGTVLYEVVAAVFIAQLSEINLELRQLLSLGVTSVISTLKAVGIPATGVATTFFVLSAVGLPAMEAAILVVVNWLLDRCNTVVNVWGSCIAVAIINQLSRDEMEKQGANRRRTGSGAERHDQDAEIPSSSQTFESIESFHSVSEDYTD